MRNNQQLALFSIFHHDVTDRSNLFDFDTEFLYAQSFEPSKYEIKAMADTISSIVTNSLKNYKDSDISLTLTGGMDSRLILAALLKAGVKPNCMTFGDPQSKDVVFSKNIADKLGIIFHNTCQAPPTKDWYYKWVIETIFRDSGNAHLHRAHRTAAIAEHSRIFQPKVLFTGHMGGEGLRGLTYNNYITSPFFEWINEGEMSFNEAISSVLNDYFLNTNVINITDLKDKVSRLPWIKHDKKANNLFFLYDFAAKIHHAQDIRLYGTYVPDVKPVFLSTEYLTALFNSPFNFLAKNEGYLGRLRNPYFYCKIIEYLYPKLLEFPFANGFSPKEYLRGLWYYVPTKLYRNRNQRKLFPPSFSYGKWYVDFIREHSSNIQPEIWEYFNKEKYFKAIEINTHGTDEGYWHKFSNPIFFDLVNRLNKGELEI